MVELERIALERRERQRPLAPRVYVRSTVDQRRGHEVGSWINAAQDVDGLTADILAVLSRSIYAKRMGAPASEWGIGGSDDFELAEPGEHESLPVVSTLARGIAQHGPAYTAWASINRQLQGSYDIPIMQRFPEAYIGDFASVQTFAEHLITERGVLDAVGPIPEWLQELSHELWSELLQNIEWHNDIHIIDHDNGIWVFDARLSPLPTNQQDTRGGDE